MSKISFRSVFSKDKDKAKDKDEKKENEPKKQDKLPEEKSVEPVQEEVPSKKTQSGKKGRKSRKTKSEPEPIPEDKTEEDGGAESQEEEIPAETAEAIPEKPVEKAAESEPIETVVEKSPEPAPAPKEEPKVMSITSLFKIKHDHPASKPAESAPAPQAVPESEAQDEEEELPEEAEVLPESSGQQDVLNEEEDYESDQIITFFLGREQFGLDILDSREVKRILPLTPIPRSPDWILGVVNLRGMVFPVVDLKKRLKIETEVECPTTFRRIIIIEISDTKIGLLVDKIHRIFNKQLLEYSAPPALISGGEDYISSIAKKDDEIISIISLKQLFTLEEREMLAKIKEKDK